MMFWCLSCGKMVANSCERERTGKGNKAAPLGPGFTWQPAQIAGGLKKSFAWQPVQDACAGIFAVSGNPRAACQFGVGILWQKLQLCFLWAAVLCLKASRCWAEVGPPLQNEAANIKAVTAIKKSLTRAFI